MSEKIKLSKKEIELYIEYSNMLNESDILLILDIDKFRSHDIKINKFMDDVGAELIEKFCIVSETILK